MHSGTRGLRGLHRETDQSVLSLLELKQLYSKRGLAAQTCSSTRSAGRTCEGFSHSQMLFRYPAD